MATISGRTASRIGGALVVVLVVALIASQCTSSDGAGPIGTGPVGPGRTGEILALGLPGEPLSVRLSAGTAQTQFDPDPVAVVEGEAARRRRRGSHLRPAARMAPAGRGPPRLQPAGRDPAASARRRDRRGPVPGRHRHSPAGRADRSARGAALPARGSRRHCPLHQHHVQPADGAPRHPRAARHARRSRHHHPRAPRPLAMDRHPHAALRARARPVRPAPHGHRVHRRDPGRHHVSRPAARWRRQSGGSSPRRPSRFSRSHPRTTRCRSSPSSWPSSTSGSTRRRCWRPSPSPPMASSSRSGWPPGPRSKPTKTSAAASTGCSRTAGWRSGPPMPSSPTPRSPSRSAPAPRPPKGPA